MRRVSAPSLEALLAFRAEAALLWAYVANNNMLIAQSVRVSVTATERAYVQSNLAMAQVWTALGSVG